LHDKFQGASPCCERRGRPDHGCGMVKKSESSEVPR
jgi:hypothetical protein